MFTATVMVKIFVLSFLSINFADSFTSNIGLIFSVHKYFGTSCVLVVHSRQDSLNEIYRIENMIRQFSAQSVLAVAVEFRRLGQAMNFYKKRVVRSLIVVSFRSRELVAKFSNLTTHFDMHSFCWLLIFDEKVYLETNATSKSGENIFNLRFDTEMLVARDHHSTIQEWYLLSDRVKMENLAVWDGDAGFKLGTSLGLYQRRMNLENSPILVTTVNNPPMISIENNTMGGLLGNIFHELGQVANFNVVFVPPNEMSYGSWDDKKKRWTGMIDMLVNGQANVAVADFTITTLRVDWVDFSLPLISTYDKLYIRRPDDRIRWSAYWQALDLGNWIMIQFLILITSVLLTTITAVRRYKITPNVFAGYFLLVLGIYCQQGLPEFPADLPSRIAYFSIFLSALIVSAAYAAALISFITVTGLTLPFKNIEEFVDDGTYSLIVFRDGAEYDMFKTATDPTLVKMAQMMKPRYMLPATIKEGFRQVCNGKVAFYVPAAIEQAIGLSASCKIVGITTTRSMSLAMALSKGNPYSGVINYQVQRFRDHGILNRLKYKSAMVQDPDISTYAVVQLWGILPVLAVLGGGVILAIFILYLERRRFSRESIKQKEHRKLASIRSEKILKIRLKNRGNYSVNSPNFYPRI